MDAESADAGNPGYAAEEIGRLELLWGEGFLSPGGAEEVTRIVGPADIAGSNVLDIGSGPGGADLVLVRRHGAASVVGIDVQQEFIDLAAARAAQAGFGEEVRYRLVDPGPLAFADASFDVVFSKDAIIHVPDKEALYADALRVLRPGGHLLIGDWLRRDGDAVDAAARAFEDRSGGDFVLISLPDLAALVAQAGFVEIETEDRGAWYLEQVTDELRRLRGELRDRLVAGWGDDDVANGTDFWEFLVKSVTIGALSPGHLRARKPPA